MLAKAKLIKKSKLLLVTLALLVGLTLGYAGFALAGSDQPGGYSDPLATKSFVEKYVQDYVAQKGLTPAPSTGVGVGDVGVGVGTGAFTWAIVELDAGEQFIGRAGTEFIIRSGSAVVVDPTGSGIPDLTTGGNIKNGQTAGNNHLFVVPKADGRGIKATKATVVMCRGY